MKKGFILLFSLIAGTLCGCSNDSSIKAEFTKYLVDKATVGETINFADALNYENDTKVKLTYSNDYVTDEEYDSLYFVTKEVSMHHFTFLFSKNNKTKTLSCSIDVIPSAPTIEKSNIAVYCSKNEKISFTELFNKSGIDAMPFGYVNTKFLSVEYYKCFNEDTISITTEKVQPVKKEISPNDTSYTFEDYGKYIFEVEIYNSAGSVSTTIQVSVFEKYTGKIEGYQFDGLIKGKKENVVELVKSNSTSRLSYLIQEDKIEIVDTNLYTLTSEFVGKNAPQLIFGFDAIDGKKYIGNGYVISLEEDSKNQFGIYGDKRFNSINLSPSRSDGNTISRNTLLEGSVYKWDVMFRLTKSTSGENNIAIMSNLYKDGSDSPLRTYKWASINASNFSGENYFGYLGSSLDDVILKYEPMKIESL